MDNVDRLAAVIPELTEKLQEFSNAQRLLSLAILVLLVALFIFIIWQQRRIGSYFSRLEDAHRATLRVSEVIDTDLRERRIKVYQTLWKLTGSLPLWPRRDITYRDLGTLSEELREWYFNEGGIFFSEPSMARYRMAQDALAVFSTERPILYIHPCEYDEMRGLLSKLRSALTADVLSRREGWRAYTPLGGESDSGNGRDLPLDQNQIIAKEGWLVHRLSKIDLSGKSNDAKVARCIVIQHIKLISEASRSHQQLHASENTRKIKAAMIAKAVSTTEFPIRATDVRGVINFAANKQRVEVVDVKAIES